MGYGGRVLNGPQTQGLWTLTEKESHINVLELKAVLLVIQALLKDRQNQHIRVRADNKTAVAHINKRRGTKSPELVEITKVLWSYCLQRNLNLTAEYLPGTQNDHADRLSRQAPETSDLQLNTQVFKQLMKIWGPCSIDLFASRTNRQLERFVIWKTDPVSTAVDAFQIPWNGEKVYAFPPFCLISQCLVKVRRDQTDLILVCPAWQTQVWFPQLLQLAVADPILLPQSLDLLTSPTGAYHPLLEEDKLHLTAWKLSGIEYWQKVCQSKLQTYLFNHGERYTASLQQLLEKWSSWCTEGQTDPFSARVGTFLDFLSDMHQQGYAYRTVNGYRSAVSAWHENVDGDPIGQHSLVTRLMSGIFNIRPPMPRYPSTWDVDVVLTFLCSLPDNAGIADDLLTHKLTMLLALTSAGQASDLQALNIEYMEDKGQEIIFTLPKLTKSRTKEIRTW